LIDLHCGWNAGVKQSILVRTGYGAQVEKKHRGELSQAIILDNLNEVANWILKKSLI